MLLLEFFLVIRTMIFFKVIFILCLLACNHTWKYLRKLHFNKWIIILFWDSEDLHKHWLANSHNVSVRQVSIIIFI